MSVFQTRNRKYNRRVINPLLAVAQVPGNLPRAMQIVTERRECLMGG